MKTTTKPKRRLLPSTLVKRVWCQYWLGKLADGTPCPGTEPKAVQFCLLGAIQRALPAKLDEFRVASKVILNGIEPAEWNNRLERTQAEVIQFLKKLEATPEFKAAWKAAKQIK